MAKSTATGKPPGVSRFEQHRFRQELVLVVDLDERDVHAVDALEIAQLVGEVQHRGLMGLEHVEHETPDLAHRWITLRSRVV